MAPNPESVKDYIWFLSSTSTSPLAEPVQHLGGGLCVSNTGLIVATIFGVCPRTSLGFDSDGSVNYSSEEDFVVTATHSNGRTWQVKLVHKFTEFGLLFYEIVKNNPWEEFNFLNLDTVTVVNQEQSRHLDVFSYLHHDSQSFSTLTACKSYPLPPNNLPFPDDIADSIVGLLSEDAIYNLYHESRKRNPPYRTVENTVDIYMCNPFNDDGVPIPDAAILPEALKLYTKLPLIQFSGLGSDTYKGSSGCSVFRMEDNSFIGLILFNLNSACFVLPSSVLQHCFTKYKGTIGGGGAY